MPKRATPIAAVISVGALVLFLAPPIRAADPVVATFGTVGFEETWVVPDGVTSIHVSLIGGKGGGKSGKQAIVAGDLAVTPGETLYINVGGHGFGCSASDAFNGGGSCSFGHDGFLVGGGGGGATDIRTISRSQPGTLASRLVVAGGAGGGGGGAGGGATQGGNAEAPGANGFQSGNELTGTGGGAGTANGGGAGGTGSTFGAAGTLGNGGAGGSATAQDWSVGGGGGGGGYYGGGGGAGVNSPVPASAGGGGGGSSYTGDATNATVGLSSEEFGSVTISYDPDQPPPTEPPATITPDTGVVDADVTVPTSAACIELSETSVTFGTQRFGGQDLTASPQIEVTNCSGSDENLLARGTDATGNGATWHLVDDAATCDGGDLATDDFHLKLNRPANEVDPVTQLSKNNKDIAELTSGDGTQLEALIDMPCPGSSGAGQTMGMQIVFVVTEAE